MVVLLTRTWRQLSYEMSNLMNFVNTNGKHYQIMRPSVLKISFFFCLKEGIKNHLFVKAHLSCVIWEVGSVHTELAIFFDYCLLLDFEIFTAMRMIDISTIANNWTSRKLYFDGLCAVWAINNRHCFFCFCKMAKLLISFAVLKIETVLHCIKMLLPQLIL